MKISLKRALKLRKELEALVAKIDLPTAAQISLLVEVNLSNPQVVLAPASEALLKRVGEYNRLSQLLAILRTEIARANVENEVEQLLAQSAHASRMMSVYKKLAAATVTPDDEQLRADLNFSKQALQTTQSAGYGRPERAMAVSVVSTKIRDSAAESYTSWKRIAESLEDTRTGKNASNNIEIAEDDAELLRQLGIV